MQSSSCRRPCIVSISFGCPVSCWTAQRDLLYLAQVRQQLLNAMLELWKPGQGLRWLQFSSIVQPALQYCRQKRENPVSSQHLMCQTVKNFNTNFNTISHLTTHGGQEGEASSGNINPSTSLQNTTPGENSNALEQCSPIELSATWKWSVLSDTVATSHMYLLSI